VQTEILKITEANQEESLKKAATIIRAGGLVVFPTETVYGLGANAFNEKALAKIFSAKGRPSDNPLIVHIANFKQLDELTDNISSLERKLIDKFWPGPLTIVFEKKKEISGLVSGGLATVAVRMPADEFARELIQQAGVPIAAPSANTSGRPSGTTGMDVFGDLVGKVDMILDTGESNIGIESTVVKVVQDIVSILRSGAVTKEMLEDVVAPSVVVFAHKQEDLQSSPGTKYKHYSPEGKLEIISNPGDMVARAALLAGGGQVVGILATNQNKDLYKKYSPNVFVLGDHENLFEISKNLYSGLRYFDTHKVDVILCPSFREEGMGVAIMDRLNKATGEQTE